MITVRYFAAARAAAGIAAEAVDTAATVAQPALLAELARRHPEPPPGEPALATVLRHASCLVNGVVLAADEPIPDGATVDILPPFAGG